MFFFLYIHLFLLQYEQFPVVRFKLAYYGPEPFHLFMDLLLHRCYSLPYIFGLMGLSHKLKKPMHNIIIINCIKFSYIIIHVCIYTGWFGIAVSAIFLLLAMLIAFSFIIKWYWIYSGT